MVFTIDTVGVEDGTVRWYSLRGANNTVITQNDFLEPIAGNVTFTANTAQLTFTANADASTLERFEYFILKLSEAEGEPPIISSDDEITIIDTSNVFALDRFTPLRNSIYETEKIIFNLYTDGGPGNAAATYYYTVTGNAELYSSNSGTLIVNDNLGNIEVIPEATIPFGESRILEVQVREDSITGNIVAESNIIVYPYITSLSNVEAVISAVTEVTPNLLFITSDFFVDFNVGVYNGDGEDLYYRTVGDIQSWLTTPNVGVVTVVGNNGIIKLRPNSVGSFYVEVRRTDANTGPLLDISPTVVKVEPLYQSYSLTSNSSYAGEQLYLNIDTINGNVLNAGTFTYNIIGNASIIGETTGILDINFDFATLPIQLEAEDIPVGEVRTLAIEITGNSTLYGPLFVTTEDVVVNRLDDTVANIRVSYVKSIAVADTNVILRDDVNRTNSIPTFIAEFGQTFNGEQFAWTISSNAEGNVYTTLGEEQRLTIFANTRNQDVVIPYTLEDLSFDYEIRRTPTSPVLGRFSNVVYRGPRYMEASGGNAEVLGNYNVHTFNTAANLSITTVSELPSLNLLEYLVVAGGGGTDNRTGYSEGAGGGGAGGMLTGNVTISSTAELIMAVGGAGAASTFAPGQPFAVPTTAGGGGSYCSGGAGGSGGGRSTGCNSSGGGGPSVSGQGFPGGSASGSPGPNASASGGGGAGAAGGALVSRNQGGTGGSGRQVPQIFGTGYFAGGGGGGSPTNSGYTSLAGQGGGGRGNSPTVDGENGLPNTGGGGGGGYRQMGRLGGTGGSGIIKVGYLAKPTFTMGNVISTESTMYAGNTVYFNLDMVNGYEGKKLYYTTSGNLTSFGSLSNVEYVQYVFSSNTGYARVNRADTAQIAISLGSVDEVKSLILHIREDSVTGNIIATSNTVNVEPSFEIYNSTTLYSSNVIESEAIILEINTAGPKGQKTFYYDVTGNADIVGNTSGSLTTPSNIFIIAEASVPAGETRFANIVIREDAVDGNIVYVSNAITINDYAASPIVNSVVSVVSAASANSSVLVKNYTFNVDVSVPNYTEPETLYYTLSGEASDYFNNSNTGSFVTSGTTNSLQFRLSNTVIETFAPSKPFEMNIRRGSANGLILSNLSSSVAIVQSHQFILANGGDETYFTIGARPWKRHTFLSSANLEIHSLATNPLYNQINYLVVAGGGGGLGRPPTHSESSGGGGGGGVLTGSTNIPISDVNPNFGNISIFSKIGAGGGGGGSTGGVGSPGGPSIALQNTSVPITATGGGGASVGFASPGGSGGGTSSGFNRGSNNAGGTGTPGQGFPGGTWIGSPGNPGALGGSGGGGAGAAGQNTPARNTGGVGGAGLFVPGTNIGVAGTWAGGGGGGSSGAVRPGGSGGGGAGANPTTNSTNGSTNSGGGAGGSTPARGTGASGGSGRIIIAYPFYPPPGDP